MQMTSGELLLGPGEVFLRLLSAILIGCVIGLNRELHGKPAGMRVHALVGMGASLISVVSIEILSPGKQMDAMLHVVQGIMAGIGFLGGGVILRDDSNHSVHGLTTAASIWVVASLGIACGAGQWLTATMALALTLAVLILGARIEPACVGWFTRRYGAPPPADPPAHPRPPGLM
jgi:putative Mg2+ transporter-C (MgtC) family protein